ncbi:tRNA (adenosine(37)-N6)-dimethylallyltransferase MiaA [Psychrobacter phenylpyruvicus]|uniref:tRNA dimethylallyltransferase n=1 Tax=Psychrobacter phenylpyruvicus TaxID=29432 RepID=A0A379LKY7_9GAMM|nr:tRNA (adenosine(37)-N6)-dimethylallyltransferase MiaA [Psychrobacter phenylpyruvicus]SUD91213.1 tRNA dimethylallyltransferase [Psychrobacter phenylpyruvicus]
MSVIDHSTKLILDQTPLPKSSVVCLMAPTASGKTSMAYELYETGRFEIISVDSALIYKDMNIGTAKPTAKELSQYPHYLVDIIDPTDTYSVASFVNDVERLIEEIHGRNKIPLLVGGTMMYYMALFDGLSAVPDTDTQVREEVEQWRKQQGIEVLHQYLKQVDPVIAERLPLGDTQRITRAVEVYKQTGKPLSEWQKLPKQALSNNPKQYWLGLAVMPDRAWLHERIELRLQLMWQQGFFEEVIELLQQYELSADMPSMRCVGYRQVIDYLLLTGHPAAKLLVNNGEAIEDKGLAVDSIDEATACQDMKNKALYATRQLAKRQYTWLRNLVASFDSSNVELANGNQQHSHMTANRQFPQTDTFNTSAQRDRGNKVVYAFATITEAKDYLNSRL